MNLFPQEIPNLNFNPFNPSPSFSPIPSPAGRRTSRAPKTSCMASKPRVKSKRAMLPAVVARYVGEHVGNPRQQKSWENIFGIKYPTLRFLVQN